MVERHRGSASQALETRGGVFPDFVDFDLLDRIVGVRPCYPESKAGSSVLTRTYIHFAVVYLTLRRDDELDRICRTHSDLRPFPCVLPDAQA